MEQPGRQVLSGRRRDAHRSSPLPVPPGLQEYVPADKLAHVQRVLYGWNCGKPVAAVPLSPKLVAAAAAASFDLQAYSFTAAPEQLRPPRIVRVGLVQNSICAPTTAPFVQQRQAIFERCRQMIDAAGAAGVQVLCLQEAWHMPFGFCTREKQWNEFAESAESGPSTRLCQELARKHGMVSGVAGPGGVPAEWLTATALHSFRGFLACTTNVSTSAAQPPSSPLPSLPTPSLPTSGDHQPHPRA